MKGSKDSYNKILSCMKRQCECVVSAKVTLKRKKHMIVITTPSDEEKKDKMMYLTSNNITIEEDGNDELIIGEDVEEALPTFESEIKPIVDELKEINLGIVENPYPTFINTNLSLEEEMDYMELLMEYRDIFAWSYDEMLGLDPMVVVHQLKVKNMARLVKQAERCFCSELIL